MEESEEERRRWGLKRGLRMGTQVVVVGLLASSAPLVVPPLLVVSAIGLSVSIPFGLLLACHACVHKLMNTLLPMPATPEHIELVDDSENIDSHKPISSAVTDDETIGFHQVVNAVADENSSARCIMSPPSNNEAAVQDEKLWKEMNAIRVVVGYEGAPEASCMDE